jgi:hypothetical protein
VLKDLKVMIKGLRVVAMVLGVRAKARFPFVWAPEQIFFIESFGS